MIYVISRTLAFNQSLYSNLPDPSLGYMDNTTGSDMFSVIRKFLGNTENLCGSTIVIAAKRYPNEVELEDLISELQKNHVFVYILSSDTPSGGSNPSAMFNVATRTNGYCVFSTEDFLKYLYVDTQFLTYAPNQFVASKFAVSGKGSQTVPFKIQGYLGHIKDVQLKIIYQDHKADGSLKSLNVTVTDEFGNEDFFPDQWYAPVTASLLRISNNPTIQYYLKIDYEYEEGRQEVMLVRVYSYEFIPDNWLPFNN
ncbi:unnamed protein product [Caenorhabditis brenneri]